MTKPRLDTFNGLLDGTVTVKATNDWHGFRVEPASHSVPFGFLKRAGLIDVNRETLELTVTARGHEVLNRLGILV